VLTYVVLLLFLLSFVIRSQSYGPIGRSCIWEKLFYVPFTLRLSQFGCEFALLFLNSTTFNICF